MNLKRDFDGAATWGLTVTLAYLLTPYIKALGITAVAVEYQILLLWTLFIIPPVYMSYHEGKGPLGWRTLNPIWSVFMVIGLVGNFFGQMFLSGEALTFGYYHKWFLLPGVLFIYTAYNMSDLSRKIYGAAAALNLLAVPLLVLKPVFQLYAFQTAAAIQGLPILIDWYVRKR